MWHEEPEATFDLVAVAASAGGVTAIIRLLSELPASFPLPMVIVQHRPVGGYLAKIVGWRTALRVKDAEQGETLQPGTVYFAPGGSHLRVTRFRALALSQEPKVNHCRPSADPLFESIATLAGPRAIAVVLTGAGRDGAAGARLVRAHGGTVIIQDPRNCEHLEMPRAAIESGAADMVLPLEHIAFALTSLAIGSEAASVAR